MFFTTENHQFWWLSTLVVYMIPTVHFPSLSNNESISSHEQDQREHHPRYQNRSSPLEYLWDVLCPIWCELLTCPNARVQGPQLRRTSPELGQKPASGLLEIFVIRPYLEVRRRTLVKYSPSSQVEQLAFPRTDNLE